MFLPWVLLGTSAANTVTIGRLDGDRIRLIISIADDMVASVKVLGKNKMFCSNKRFTDLYNVVCNIYKNVVCCVIVDASIINYLKADA